MSATAFQRMRREQNKKKVAKDELKVKETKKTKNNKKVTENTKNTE